MRIDRLTDLFEDHGVLLEAPPGERASDLDADAVVGLFERHGVVLFRGFGVDGRTLSQFTDLYTERYARDAGRRAARFDDTVVHDVDAGTDAHTLHSEASYSPAWPEIVWFCCVVPPVEGGATTLCDGVRLWQRLSADAKGFFLREPLRFDVEVSIGEPRPGKGRRPWVADAPGASGDIDWETGTLRLTQLRFAVHETRTGRGLSFCNHLQAELGKDPQLRNREMVTAGGAPVPEHLLDEIRQVSAALTYDHQWQRGDVLMVDNRRFMHGRRAFRGPRDVVNVQTAKASFGFGATTRRRIQRAVAASSSV